MDYSSSLKDLDLRTVASLKSIKNPEWFLNVPFPWSFNNKQMYFLVP